MVTVDQALLNQLQDLRTTIIKVVLQEEVISIPNQLQIVITAQNLAQRNLTIAIIMATVDQALLNRLQDLRITAIREVLQEEVISIPNRSRITLITNQVPEIAALLHPPHQEVVVRVIKDLLHQVDQDNI